MIDPFYLPKIKRLDIPKNINGVYFIFDNGEIIYVGQSKNICRSYMIHKIKFRWKDLTKEMKRKVY